MTDYQPATAAPDANGAPIKDRATDAAQVARNAGTDVAQTAANNAKTVLQESSKQTRDLIGEAREQVMRQAGTQRRVLVDNMRSLGDELDGMTGRSEQSGVGAELVGQARDRLHGAADWLDAREPGDLLEEIRSFAGRRPGTFLLGAAMAGVVTGRLTRGVAATHSNGEGDSRPEQDRAVQP